MNAEKIYERPKGVGLTSSEVRTLRERMGMTQKELAEALGVTEFAVWRWENQQSQHGRGCSKANSKLLQIMAAQHGVTLGSPSA